MKRFKKFIRIFLYVHGVLIIALLLTHCSVTKKAKREYDEAVKEKPFDVVIVPGIPYDSVNGNRVMTMRVYWAKLLYDSGFTKNVIFSGSSVYNSYVEGIVMKIMADSLGIPSDHTFAETKAEHSTENVFYSWKMAKELGFEKIALATDPYQSALLSSFRKKYCPGVQSMPIIFGTMNIDSLKLPVINPASAFRKSSVPITEREGFWKRFRGTMGKRVKQEVKEEKKARRKLDEKGAAEEPAK
jgi:uncharacterized SAM-binding protein YcdF (DUF218 family)